MLSAFVIFFALGRCLASLPFGEPIQTNNNVSCLCARASHPHRFHLRPYRIPMDTLRTKHSAVLDLVTTLLGEPLSRSRTHRSGLFFAFSIWR